jgi:hypothetical protein
MLRGRSIHLGPAGRRDATYPALFPGRTGGATAGALPKLTPPETKNCRAIVERYWVGVGTVTWGIPRPAKPGATSTRAMLQKPAPPLPP